jgi:formate hydrogenlyase subunit 4
MRSRRVARRDLTQVAIFFTAVLVSLFLIPVFPRSRILQTINSNAMSFVLLVVLASLLSVFIPRLIFRGKK